MKNQAFLTSIIGGVVLVIIVFAGGIYLLKTATTVPEAVVTTVAHPTAVLDSEFGENSVFFKTTQLGQQVNPVSNFLVPVTVDSSQIGKTDLSTYE